MIRVSFIAGITIYALTLATAAFSQETVTESRKTLEVKIKVTTKGGEPIPDDSKVEVSGQEAACGSFNDLKKSLDGNGETTFSSVPACIVSIKALVGGFIQG